MDSIKTFDRLYTGVSQAVLGTDCDSILFANPAARDIFGSDILRKSAVDAIPKAILEQDSDCFFCACEILGIKAEIRVVRDSGILILIIDPLCGCGDASSLSKSTMINMRSSAMGLKMAADRCFFRLEDGNIPDSKTISSFYHYYYSLLHAITQLDSADKLEHREMDFSPESTELVSLFTELTDTISLLCRESGVAISFSTKEERIYTMADSAKLEQLVLDLLAYCLKHTQSGGRIAVSLVLMGDRVVISIDDNGRPPESSLKPFSLPTGTEEPDSRGLELYIAYGIAQLHGGTILMGNSAGGTNVRVSLPLIPPPGNLLMESGTAYKAKGPSLVLTELADVLSTSCYGPRYED